MSQSVGGCIDKHGCVDMQVPFSLVFTKTDKRKKKCPSPRENMQAFQVRSLSFVRYCMMQQISMMLSAANGSDSVVDQEIRHEEGSTSALRLAQAALLKEFENLPLIFETDSETQKGHAELLNHIARLGGL